MFSRSLVRKIGKKFDWTEDQTKNALDAFTHQPSILDNEKLEEFLNICVESGTPEKRFTNAAAYYAGILQESDIVETISSLLYIDSSIIALATFNIKDYIGTIGKDVEENFLYISPRALDTPGPRYREEIEQYEYGLILPFNYYVSHFRSRFLDYDHNIKFYTSSEEMSYRLIDKFFYGAHIRHADALIKLYYEIYKRVGYKVINIGHFRYLMNELDSVDKGSDIDIFEEWNDMLEGIFNTQSLSTAENTRRRYWLYYLAVENLKERGMKTDAAFDAVAKITREGWSTIHRTYYRMKKEAKKNGLKKRDILLKEHLYFPLEELLGAL